MKDKIKERAFRDYPEEHIPDGDREILYKMDYPDFGIGGIDAQQRLVSFGDDGWIVGYHLDTASVNQDRYGKSLDAEHDTLAHQSMPEPFMFGKDVSEWVWVHPRYRWLTES